MSRLWSLSLSLRPLGAALLLALAALGGCGSDESPCESMVDAICEAACSCGGAAGCAIGDTSGAITFDDKKGCVALYNLVCSEPASGFGYAKCEADLSPPRCVQSTDGMAVMLPASCDME